MQLTSADSESDLCDGVTDDHVVTDHSCSHKIDFLKTILQAQSGFLLGSLCRLTQIVTLCYEIINIFYKVIFCVFIKTICRLRSSHQRP